MSCTSPLIRVDYERSRDRISKIGGDYAWIYGDKFVRLGRLHNGGFFVKLKELLNLYPEYYKLEQMSIDFQQIPCGKCISCRLKRSRDWALRVMLEAEKYPNNYFLTLTYNDANLPTVDELHADGEFIEGVPTLVKRHLTLFMKRFRRRYGEGIRFFACGEYGSLYERPHYHLCLMNCPDFSDKLQFYRRDQETGDILYILPEIDDIWQNENGYCRGFSTIAPLSWNTAAYTARYIMKKQLGKNSLAKLEKENPGTTYKVPEYVVMSRRPGLAKDYFDEHKQEIYLTDSIVAKFGDRLYETKPARYFDKLYDIYNPDEMAKIRSDRSSLGANAILREMEATSLDRSSYLAKKGDIVRVRANRLRRGLED